jgi:death-on-curing protein
VNDESGFIEEPVYLILEDVLEIYAAIIGGTAAQAADHLRSRDALEGALARPVTYAHYQQADIALQAAVLAHGIAETQPFIDGNKRAALVTMLTFLEINGYRVRATDRELADWIISFSRGNTPEAMAETVRDRITQIGPGA